MAPRQAGMPDLNRKSAMTLWMPTHQGVGRRMILRGLRSRYGMAY